jgi:hypothetical protein
MFGGPDDNAQAQDNASQPGQDGALHGVNDLANGSVPPTPPPAYDSDGGFMSAPGDPGQNNGGTPTHDGLNEGATLPEPSADAGTAPAPAASGDDLLDLKQQALQQLSPLIGHLDQTPEEKFRTTMMMIQATDNQALLKDAYDAAQQITDEKARAQALLDVVNEINYFSQNKSQQPQQQ